MKFFHGKVCSALTILSATILLLASCHSRTDGEPVNIVVDPSVNDVGLKPETEAKITIRPGASPFISFVDIPIKNMSQLSKIKYLIVPKPHAFSKAVNVTYSLKYLLEHGYAVERLRFVTVPIFGLYAFYDNAVVIDIQFRDGTNRLVPITISTDIHLDPMESYSRPLIVKKRESNDQLGFNYFVMKNGFGAPIVVDTDGEIRWTVTGNTSDSSIFYDNGFVVGNTDWTAAHNPTVFFRLELDGTNTRLPFGLAKSLNFHHNLDKGKHGVLGEVDAVFNGVTHFQTVLTEFDPETGEVTHFWDLDTILKDFMRRLGDDPSKFVLSGTDWFHMNAATYDSRDDTVIVSSREHFIIKLDYLSGSIIWILGDPAKYWHTFESLRTKAVTVEKGGLYPIGQHSTSIGSDGSLLVFNNGSPTFRLLPEIIESHPEYVGDQRDYSAISSYLIDQEKMTAINVWNFDYGRALRSPTRGSVYEGLDNSFLVNFATTENGVVARLIGLNSDRNVAFDFQYNSFQGQIGWNSEIIPFENLKF